ncbi:hypothetical protein J7U46_22370 [Pelomonas sp. V22]|uniref:hypothetical protein n=1 Tax=Pelomonas sp. V22 TaxID=2822139 RepID=UPI0024A89D0D|nr:hypothetical protein [Pelomonas sp. V22]MDI4635828.1 hypothetical protein [Pelomonas sp. V22]
MRFLPIVTLLFQLPVLAEEPLRPPAGQNINESKEVRLRTSVKLPCLAFPVGDATVILQNEELEEYARQDAEVVGSRDAEIAPLNGDRARSLLRGYFTEGEVHGCPLARAVPGDGRRLILRQIELGRAAILAPGSSMLSPYASVRYYGSATNGHGAGFISVGLPGVRREILSLSWWAT